MSQIVARNRGASSPSEGMLLAKTTGGESGHVIGEFISGRARPPSRQRNGAPRGRVGNDKLNANTLRDKSVGEMGKLITGDDVRSLWISYCE